MGYNDLSHFFLFEAPPADKSPIGREIADKMIRTLKGTCVQARDAYVLRGYLVAWNQRSASPFTSDELDKLSNLEAEPRKKKARLPEPEAFAVRMFEDPR